MIHRVIASLKREAKYTATLRGHLLGRFIHYPSANRIKPGQHARALSVCQNCNMDVLCITHPAPNEIEIGGGAVGRNCPKKRKSR